MAKTQPLKVELICGKCGWIYPMSFAADWGREQSTIGYGRTPCCVQLIDGPDTPPGSLEVCGGWLYPAVPNP